MHCEPLQPMATVPHSSPSAPTGAHTRHPKEASTQEAAHAPVKIPTLPPPRSQTVQAQRTAQSVIKTAGGMRAGAQASAGRRGTAPGPDPLSLPPTLKPLHLSTTPSTPVPSHPPKPPPEQARGGGPSPIASPPGTTRIAPGGTPSTPKSCLPPPPHLHPSSPACQSSSWHPS